VAPKRTAPLSPHLGIYKWHLTMFLSITHRFTEIVLYGFSLVLFTLVIIGIDPLRFPLPEAFFTFLWGCFLSVFFYHLLGLCRHLFMDFGWGFSVKAIYRTGYAMLFIAAVLITFVWLRLLGVCAC